jgi:hypothetical protein
MDDGYTNADPTVDAADAFNEWYKAAAWNPSSARNAAFGFGRETLTAADANFRCSGDPFESAEQCGSGGTTSVGFYDGTLKPHLPAGFATNGNENSFSLADMSGNAHQWMQDRYAPSTSIDRRALRGGSWNDPASAGTLRTSRRTLWAPPGTVSAEIGFRVVRVPQPPSGDFTSDAKITLDDAAHLTHCVGDPQSPAPAGCARADFDLDGDVDLADLAIWQSLFDG